MALLNISGRPCTITVEGVDLSVHLQSFEAGDNKIDESGLILTEGTAELNAIADVEYDLDDRFNPIFAKGNKVTITVDDAIVPRGLLRIREAHYTPKGRHLTLNLCCLFSLLSYDQERSDRSKHCTGKATRIKEVINGLLAEAGQVAGVTLELIDDIPGYIDIPIQGNNPIQIAGAIAFSRGYCLTLDNDEKVRAIKIDLNSIGGDTQGLDEIVDYDRLSSGEVPPSKIAISGSVNCVSRRSQTGKTTIISEGLGRYSITEETFNGYVRTVRTKTREQIKNVMSWYDPDNPAMIWSEIKEEVSYYRSRLLVIKKDGEEDDDCEDGVEKVLYKKKATILKPFGVTLAAWVQLHELDKAKNITFINLSGTKSTIIINYFALITDTVETTDYDYGYRHPDDVKCKEDDDLTLAAQKIITQKDEPQAKIFAKPFELTAKTPITTPEALVPSERYTQTWYKARGEYVYHEQRLQAFATYDSQAAEEMWVKDQDDLVFVSKNSYTALVIAENKFTFSSSGQSQPPAPETAPPKFEVVTQQKTFEAEVQSPYLVAYSLPKNFRIEYPISDSAIADNTEQDYLKAIEIYKQQAQAIGKILMALAWGRYKGVRITDEMLTSYRPLEPFTLIEEGRICNYVRDAFAIALTVRRAVCSFDGVWVGNQSGIGGGSVTVSSGTGTTEGGTLIACDYPIPNDIPQGTTIYFGGTLQNAILSIATTTPTQLNLSSGTTTAIDKGTLINVDGTNVVVSQDVPVGATTVPIFATPFAIADNSTGNYSQVVGGTAVVASAFVPAGSTAIPVEPISSAIAPNTTGVYQFPIRPPIFTLVYPLSIDLGIEAAAKTLYYVAGSLGTQAAAAHLGMNVSPLVNIAAVAVAIHLGLTADAREKPLQSEVHLGMTASVITTPASAQMNLSRIVVSPTSASTTLLRLSKIVDKVRVVVTVPFNDSGWNLTVGDAADNDRFVESAIVNLGVNNVVEVNPGYSYVNPTAVNVYFNPGTATTGEVIIYLYEG